MAPSIFNFKELRRRSRASFRTESSASEAGSQGNTPTSGSLTPPSIAQTSDPALNLQLHKEQQLSRRPSLQTVQSGVNGSNGSNGVNGGSSNRYSVSGMTGLGSPINGKSSLPVSQYAPRIANVAENAWVSSNPSSTGSETVVRTSRALPTSAPDILIGIVDPSRKRHDS